MEIVRLTLGPFAVHTYIVKEGDFCAVIDPEENNGEIEAALRGRGWTPTDILLTHTHIDHLRGVNGLPETAALHVHEAEAHLVHGRNTDVGFPFAKSRTIDRPVTPFVEGVTIGPFTVIHTPGHSPGGSLFVAPGHVFSGDSMFVMGITKLDAPLSDVPAYMRSIQTMYALDGNARLHAGHGADGFVRDGIPR